MDLIEDLLLLLLLLLLKPVKNSNWSTCHSLNLVKILQISFKDNTFCGRCLTHKISP